MKGDLQSFIAAWDLFRDAALAGAAAGMLLGFLGVYVVLRRMVFLSAVLSQAAGLGVTLTFFLQALVGWSAAAAPTWGAALVTLLLLTYVVRSKHDGSMPLDSLLGLTYVLCAAATLALATRIVQEMHDIQSLLFGSAVAVLPKDFQAITGVAVSLTLLHLWWRRGFLLVTYDPEGAKVRGLPVRLLETALMVSLALAISLCTRVLGALPVFAFSVMPALAALRLAPNATWALVGAAGAGACCGFGGYVAAYLYQLPVGAAQALAAGGMVVASHVLGRLLAVER